MLSGNEVMIRRLKQQNMIKKYVDADVHALAQHLVGRS